MSTETISPTSISVGFYLDGISDDDTKRLEKQIARVLAAIGLDAFYEWPDGPELLRVTAKADDQVRQMMIREVGDLLPLHFAYDVYKYGDEAYALFVGKE